MDTLHFRNATLADLPGIVAIYNSTVASRMVTADTEPVSVASRIPWFEVHTADKWPLWVVECNQEMVGWVSLQAFYGRPAYAATAEVSIYLAEEARSQGFGKRILQHCIDKAYQFSINTLLGFIFAHNEPSLQLFKKAGFQEWGFLPNIAVLDGIERSVVILGKRI
ncbi:MAG: N-acetyltransferase family protein [Bacteroidota bacterium]